MDYKLIAIDLDGTLLNDNKELTEENIRILRMLYSRGIEIIIATGRRYYSAKELVGKLELDLVIMANNGNIIRRISDDKLLIAKYLTTEDFHTLIKTGKKKGLHPIVHTNYYSEGYDVLIELDKNDERYFSYLSKIHDRYKKVNDLLEHENPRVLVTCYIGEADKLESFQKEIITVFPDKYNSHIMKKTKIGAILEFMNPLGSKWISLKEYAREKGINTKEIIAIGDDNNDIDMVRNSGLGIAMKNGTVEIKKAADIITSRNNNESGVAFILKDIFRI